MKITSTQLRRIIKEEARKVIGEASSADPQIAALMKKFVVDVRAVDPSMNFGDLEDALRKTFRRPAKPLSPAARSAASAKAAETRAASKAAAERGTAYSSQIAKNRERVMTALADSGVSAEDYSDAEMQVFGGGSHDATNLDVLKIVLGSKSKAMSMLKSLGIDPNNY
jgi:hypothetical protein